MGLLKQSKSISFSAVRIAFHDMYLRSKRTCFNFESPDGNIV